MVCVYQSLNTLACFSFFLASIAQSEDGQAGYDPTKTVYPGNLTLETDSGAETEREDREQMR